MTCCQFHQKRFWRRAPLVPKALNIIEPKMHKKTNNGSGEDFRFK